MKQLKINNSNRFALVDDEDYDKLSRYNWSYNKYQGIIRASIRTDKPYIPNTKKILSREIMKPPLDMVVDHADNDKFNNCKLNLRVCKQVKNCFNKIKTQSICSSKYKGVYYDSTNKSWKAEIQANNKKVRLGTFINEIEAAKAYNTKAIELHGEFARLNILDYKEND